MNLTRKIDLVGYLHIGYGALLILVAALIILSVTVGAFVLPALAAWVAGLGASVAAGLMLAAVGLPSMIAGVMLIRRSSFARAAIILLSVIDLFSFPVGTALGAFSLWTLLKDGARLEFT